MDPGRHPEGSGQSDHHAGLAVSSAVAGRGHDRGRLIVLEGIEGAGKSTQLARLLSWLEQKGVAASGIREPGTSAVGNAIRALLLDPAYDVDPRAEALLFLAARAQLVARELRELLDSASVVVCDRFMLSTYAYQGEGRQLGVETIRALNAFAVNGLVPDATVVLDVPPQEGLTRVAGRGAADRMEAAGTDFHSRVAAAFRRFSEPEWQAAHPECGPIVRVDASGSEEVVFESVLRGLSGLLPETFNMAARS